MSFLDGRLQGDRIYSLRRENLSAANLDQTLSRHAADGWPHSYSICHPITINCISFAHDADHLVSDPYTGAIVLKLYKGSALIRTFTVTASDYVDFSSPGVTGTPRSFYYMINEKEKITYNPGEFLTMTINYSASDMTTGMEIFVQLYATIN